MTSHPYDRLTPETILDAVESKGFLCTGVLLPLNSYENRVYRVDTEGGQLAAKFYRPERWDDRQILEEHAFARELADQEIPAVAPAADAGGHTLHHYQGFRFALFPWRGGRAPELHNPEDRRRLGRYLARVHRVGAAAPFRHRERLSVESYGRRSVELLRASPFIPPELHASYFAIADQLLARLDDTFAHAGDLAWIRVHGDFHLGNILWTDTGAHLVDFDDSLTAPAVQDLWMLLSGEAPEMEAQLADILEGYSEFRDFDAAELRLVEPLRTLRMLRYSAWIAARWSDPAFPRAFPWFGTNRYWEEQILALKQQLAALDEPVLGWRPGGHHP
jgi:Ser/Thr protein kinase RdoA (MazF antagonist)